MFVLTRGRLPFVLLDVSRDCKGQRMIVYFSGAPGNRTGIPETVLKGANIMLSYADMRKEPNARFKNILKTRCRSPRVKETRKGEQKPIGSAAPNKKQGGS